MKDWLAFMDKYYPDGDKDDSYAIFGYAAAEALMQVLNQCGDDFSRENIMRQAASLRDFQRPIALPNIRINTWPTDFRRSSRCGWCSSTACLAADRRRDRDRVRERARR